MKKMFFVALLVAILATSTLFPVAAYAGTPAAACNDGTMNAHMNAMPGNPAEGESQVPGIPNPGLSVEVPGHDHVPECE